MSDAAPGEGKSTLAQKVAWGILLIAVAGLMGAAIYKKMNPPEPDIGRPIPGSGSSAPKPEDLHDWGPTGDFKLVDQDGKTIEAKDLKGEVWIADFIFTRCAGTCPQMVRAMADLDKELADLPQVKLISFSMDPEYDTPEVLKKYAQKHNAVSPRWKFLTGDKEQIYKLTRGQFKLTTQENPSNPDEPILHSSMFVLVDKNGRIRGYFGGLMADGPNLENMKLLAKSVRKL